jgi:NADPH:quinone reductase-like Zn-dependent oxidoreductase/enoyl-CoA hydratase/carnithine racemase
VHEHGGPEVLRHEEIETPEIRADEALVRVKACGMNHLDLWVRRGVPGHEFPLPLIPGCDTAGVVQAVGEGVSGHAAGDEVIVSPGHSCGHCVRCLTGRHNLCRRYGIMGETRDGGYAEFVAVPGVNLVAKPITLDFVEAAAVPLVFLTAWHMLVGRAGVRPGDWVLVHAGGSGVGSAAIQIAKLHGANVITTASTKAKLDKAAELGADHLVNYEEEDFSKAVRKLTNKRGVDVVFEHTGEATWPGSLKSVARGGTIVTCGATSGFKAESDLRVVFFKQVSILGSTMGSLGEVLEVLRHLAEGCPRRPTPTSTWRGGSSSARSSSCRRSRRMETILVEVEDRIATLSLDRPEKKNALSLAMVREIHAAMDELAARDDVGVLILASTDPKCFTAGADVKELKDRKKADALLGINQNAARRFEEFPYPTIAAVRGHALGIGTELAIACDLRVAGESARFGQPEVGLGITPAAGGMQRLLRLVGVAKAKELIFTGDIVDAPTALELGLVNRVVPDDEVLGAARELAGRILANGTLAVRLAKAAVNAAARGAGEHMNLIESLAQAILFDDEEKLARMRAFLDRKKAK